MWELRPELYVEPIAQKNTQVLEQVDEVDEEAAREEQSRVDFQNMIREACARRKAKLSTVQKPNKVPEPNEVLEPNEDLEYEVDEMGVLNDPRDVIRHTL